MTSGNNAKELLEKGFCPKCAIPLEKQVGKAEDSFDEKRCPRCRKTYQILRTDSDGMFSFNDIVSGDPTS